MATRKIAITNGPSKFGIAVSLFDEAESHIQRKTVTFHLPIHLFNHTSLDIIIDGIIRQDEKKEVWRITGHTKLNFLREHTPFDPFTATYSTRTRRGEIEIKE